MIPGYTPGYDPGWLGKPKPTPQMVPPQYSNPGFGASGSPYGSQIGLTGRGSYSNPGGVNDPTLAPGYSGSYGGGPATGVGGLPPGAIRPPFQWAGRGLPNNYASAGWRIVHGPDGDTYWAPPGSQQQAPPNYTSY